MKPGDIIAIQRSDIGVVVKAGDELRQHRGVVDRKGDMVWFTCPDCDVITVGRADCTDCVMCAGCKLVFRLEDV